MRNVRYVIEFDESVDRDAIAAFMRQFETTNRKAIAIGPGVRVHDLRTGRRVGGASLIRSDPALMPPREPLRSHFIPFVIAAGVFVLVATTLLVVTVALEYLF